MGKGLFYYMPTNNLETETEVTTMVSHLVMNWLFDLEEVCYQGLGVEYPSKSVVGMNCE